MTKRIILITAIIFISLSSAAPISDDTAQFSKADSVLIQELKITANTAIAISCIACIAALIITIFGSLTDNRQTEEIRELQK